MATKKCYIIVFEVADEATRQALRARIKTYKTFCPLTKTCWALATEHSAREVRDDLKEVIPAGDRLYVLRSGTEAAWKNSYGPSHSEWLKKYL